MRDEAWRRRFAMEESFAKAKPGRGHRALRSSLSRRQGAGAGDAEHRQSASGLRHRAGRRRRIARQYHLRHLPRLRAALRTCHGSRQKFEAAGEHAPDCACGGYIKTATVSFGQAMPAEADAARRGIEPQIAICFSPSARRWWCGRRPDFRCMAKRNGAALVIVNREPTEFDDIADLVVRNDIGDVLGPFIAH